jgi:hypothetical protein
MIDDNITQEESKPSSSKENLLGCLFHIIVPLLFIGCYYGYYHFFPKTKEQLAEENDPNRKIYFEKFDPKNYHPELKQKIARLDSISKSLNEILYFVDYQKTSLETQNQNLEELIKENKELEPVVNTKKELVDAIFRVQEQRNLKDKRRDQIIGFIFGVLSSLVASLIIYLWKKITKAKQDNSN